MLCSLVVASAWFVTPPAPAARISSRSSPTLSSVTARRRRSGNTAAAAAAEPSSSWVNGYGRRRGRDSRSRLSMVAAGKNWEWGRAKSSGDAPTPAAKAFGTGQELKLGVLLLNLGGPERPEDVQPFLYNLFADPDIIRLPKLVRWLQAPIASVLAARRCVVCLSRGAGGGCRVIGRSGRCGALSAVSLSLVRICRCAGTKYVSERPRCCVHSFFLLDFWRTVIPRYLRRYHRFLLVLASVLGE